MVRAPIVESPLPTARLDAMHRAADGWRRRTNVRADEVAGGAVARTEPDPGTPAIVGESRWPSAIAVLVLIGTTLLAPGPFGIGPLVATLEIVILVALLLGDPGRIDRRSRWIRRASLLLIWIMVASALVFTGVLIYDLVVGAKITDDPTTLLAAGAKVWLANTIAFALLYWELDGGGPAQRAHGMPRYPDLGFPQLLDRELAPPGWRPRFVDYLYLALTTANAFSPTDTPPLATWAKVAMAVQGIVSFVIAGLVIARAVNVFT
jgi:uncharacterized membrane protein